MSNPERKPDEEMPAVLRAVGRRLQRLTVAVVLMALAVAVLAGSVYGTLVDYFARDPLLYGGTLIGAALLGFGFGWFARGRL